MEVNYQIHVKVVNYDSANRTKVTNITTNDLTRFATLIAALKKNINKNNWNWFTYGLPDEWNGNTYVLDVQALRSHMMTKFDYEVNDIELFKEFFLRFVGNGDRLDDIKLFKVEEIEIT